MKTVMDHKYISPICHDRGCQYLVFTARPAPNHFVSASCNGEYCRVCSKPATHKLGEEIATDDPQQMRHNLTAYVCCSHFRAIVGGMCQ